MTSFAAALLVGLAAGAHTSTWGMYKDAAHEGFTLPKYLRSIVLSGLIAPALVAAGFPVRNVGSLIVLFGVTYVLERITSEFYKTFIRNEDQSKYTIPMQLAVRGRCVHGRGKRLLAGLAVAATALALAAGVLALQPLADTTLRIPLVLAVGSLGGWCSAFGGAWKDAPIEGFQTLKFFRSPVLSSLYALSLSLFTPSLALAALGGLGFTIATLETYKTFFFPSRPRGKFAGKPVLFPEHLETRKRFVPLYAAIWIVVIGALVIGYWAGDVRY
jgi:hypothetical protein